MIKDLIENFNQCWKYIETMPMDFLVEDAGDCFRIIIKNTCEWYTHGSGCTMCNYSDRSGSNATNVIIKYGDIIIEKLLYLNKTYKRLKLYINGSFFNENELQIDIAIKFINTIKKRLNITHICVETRPEFVDASKLNNFVQNTGLNCEVCFGIESTNDEIRNSCLNKGLDINEFYMLVKQIEHICSVKVYLLVKPPFITERQAIEDIVKSVNELVSKGITNISYTPIAVQNNTLLEFLLQEKLYRPVWIWSLIEINERLKNMRKSYPQIHLSGLDYFPRPILATFNCDRCTQDLLRLLKDNRNLGWDDIKDYMDCECYQVWLNEISYDYLLPSIEEQIRASQEILNKNIQRSKQISSRINAMENVGYLTDVAKTMPDYKIALDYVGIENLNIPIQIVGYPDTIATCSYSVELDEFHRGIHMSRLIEQLNYFADIEHKDILKDIKCLIKNDNAIDSKMDLCCVLFKKNKTKVTCKDNYNAISVDIAVLSNKNGISINVEISVPFINACPCTLITANELYNESFTHTQKGNIKVTFCDMSISLEEMLVFMEEYISIYDLLKREDEVCVVKKAFNNAAFCEDICRELSCELYKKFKNRGKKIKIKVITDESIHPHRAFAQKEILL